MWMYPPAEVFNKLFTPDRRNRIHSCSLSCRNESSQHPHENADANGHDHIGTGYENRKIQEVGKYLGKQEDQR